MIGTTISHYKITGKLGEGGMGVVYKAEDTSLERPVALKFLAPHLVSDEEVRKRFEREAKAAAALNHPNVCTVHEIAEANGRTFIAMAFIEGDSLEAKIEAGPLKLKDALDIAIQTAQGLQAAHEKKIVHRDIKPANLMVTGEGSKQLVTIMDFGLALLTDRSKLTQMDETMGTVTYMSPEQAQGMDLDHRTDVWSLGAVIYEMVTGQQAFKGHYDQATVYSILNEDPEPMTALRTGVPMELEWIAGKCLAKDIENRYQNAGDMVVDLRNLQDKLKSGKSTILRTAPAGSVGARHAVPAAGEQATGTRAQHAVPLHSPGEPSEYKLAKYRVIEEVAESDTSTKYLAEDTELHRSVAIRVLPQSSAEKIERAQQRKQTVLLGATALAVLLTLVFAFFPLFSPVPVDEVPLRRFTVTLPVNVPTDLGSGRFDNSLAISPNGKDVAFVETGEQGRLWVRDLDQRQPRVIERTEGARNPFWSPDSTQIGFVAGGQVKKVSVQGGPASVVCDLPGGHFHGGTWSPDGQVVVFSSGPSGGVHRLYQVPTQGGTAGVVLAPKDLAQASEQVEGIANQLAWSHFLPSEAGARVLVLTYGTGSEQTMFVQDLETARVERLGLGAAPVYAASGHLLYTTTPISSDLWALPFSLETLQATAEPFPVVEDSRSASVARDGTLVYLDTGGSEARQQLVWVDRDGNKVEEISEPREIILEAALSPDGRWVAFSVQEDADFDVWRRDLARGVSNRLTTSPAIDVRPVWSPGSDRVVFTTLRRGNLDIYFRLAQVRHGDGCRSTKFFRMSVGLGKVCTTFGVKTEPLR